MGEVILSFQIVVEHMTFKEHMDVLLTVHFGCECECLIFIDFKSVYSGLFFFHVKYLTTKTQILHQLARSCCFGFV